MFNLMICNITKIRILHQQWSCFIFNVFFNWLWRLLILLICLLTGRPHGGIGFIANRVRGITYKPLNVDCDRITGMQLVSNGKIVMTLSGVYLPCFRANADQIKLYSETLDILQSTIDGMDPSPIMIVGDMNAPLPRQAELSRYWYILYPF